MVRRHEGFTPQPTQELDRSTWGTTLDLLDAPTPEIEPLTGPTREDFKDGKFKSYVDFYETHEDNAGQRQQIANFIELVTTKTQEGGSEILSLAYDEYGTLRAVIAGEENPDIVSIHEMNPLDGPGEGVVVEGVKLNYSKDTEGRISALASFEDDLGNKTDINLKGYGEGTTVSQATPNGSRSESAVVWAGNLHNELRHHTPWTQEDIASKGKRDINRIESDENSFRHLDEKEVLADIGEIPNY